MCGTPKCEGHIPDGGGLGHRIWQLCEGKMLSEMRQNVQHRGSFLAREETNFMVKIKGQTDDVYCR